MKIALDESQMENLESLGVKTNDSSMVRVIDPTEKHITLENRWGLWTNLEGYTICGNAFTFDDILKKLPFYLNYDEPYSRRTFYMSATSLGYMGLDGSPQMNSIPVVSFNFKNKESMLDAAYNLLVWVKNKKH